MRTDFYLAMRRIGCKLSRPTVLVLVVVATLIAPVPALADPGTPEPTPAKVSVEANVSPQHTVVCTASGGYPYFASNDTMTGWAYFECSAAGVDFLELCVRTQVFDKAEKVWVNNSLTNYCALPTAIVGNVQAWGQCIGLPGNWVWSYRIRFTLTAFHHVWDQDSGYGPAKNLSC